ncbi:MAG: hypothetical protein ABUS79_08105 [Pseudomonadota bacterium]
MSETAWLGERPDPNVSSGVARPQEAGAANGGDAGGSDIDKLEMEVALKRRRATASLGELRRRVMGAAHWRQWPRDHLLLWIAAGVSLGFWVGYRGQNNRRS